jgi:hypothetical protein
VERRTNRSNLETVVCLVFAFLFFGTCAVAQLPGVCSQKAYKILTPTALAINCITKIDTLKIDGGTGMIVLNGGSNYLQPIGNAKVSLFSDKESDWLLITLSGSPGRIEPGKKYTLTLSYSVAGILAAKPEPPIQVDATETYTVAASNVDSHSARSFQFSSAVGISDTGNSLSFLKWQDLGGGRKRMATHDCNIPVVDGENRLLSAPAKCSTLTSLSTPPTEEELKGVDPLIVGIYDVEFDVAPATPLIPGTPPFKTIFGNTPKIDPKSRFSPKKAPATKDASQYYFNLNWAAGRGTVPAWVLDGQVAPTLWMSRGFALGPVASADVGNNKLSGQTYTDTIDFGFTAQKPHFFRDTPHPVLGEMLFVTGAKYETDKEFDRDNVLGTADLRFNFSGLYHTRQVGALQRFSRAMKQYQDQKKANQSPAYVPQVDDFQPPLVGYALDFHTGIEAGGSIIDTTVHASTGKATEVLPAYPIFRFVPQVHGLLELGKVSFDANMTGRGLTLTENTVLETASHTLFLKQISGWKGLLTLTNTYTFDPQGHFAINFTFKDGFAPPVYKRVNAVQAGLLFKY